MNTRHLLRLLPIFVAAVTLSLPAIAQDTKTVQGRDVKTKDTKDASPTGTWEWDREGPNGSVHCVLSLKEKDGKVKGKFKNDHLELDVEQGTFDEGKVEVQFTATVEGTDYKIRLVGEVGKEKIEGQVYVDSGEGEQELEWIAKRTFPLESAVGKWRMFFTTPDGEEMRPEFELKAKDGKAEVEFIDGDGIEISNVKYDGGNLKFTINLEFNGQPLEVDYDLNLEGNQLYGVLQFNFTDGGEQGELDIEGSRFK